MIELYYSINNLINVAQVETLNYSENIIDEITGEPLLDQFSISEIDESYVTRLLRSVAKDIYSIIVPYTTGLDALDEPLDGFEFNITIDEVTEGNAIVFRLIMPDTWPENNKIPLDNSIEETMINYVVGTFLKKKRADSSIFEKTYQDNRNDILTHINKRVGLKRTYKLY